MMVRVPTLFMASVLPPIPLRRTGAMPWVVQLLMSVRKSGCANDTDAPESTFRIMSLVSTLLCLLSVDIVIMASEIADGKFTP